MKKPVCKSDVAYMLGKAAQYCDSIRDIFDALDKNLDDMERAISFIENEIDKEIDNLKGQK